MCQVEVAAGGCSYRASGAVRGGLPVLLELCGSLFRQPVALAGSLLFFKARASPQLLSSVAGESLTGVHGGEPVVFSRLLSLDCPRPGLLTTAGVDVESFSAPAGGAGSLWYSAGVSTLLPDLSALKPLVEDAAQLSL